ncbi:hypothetical protein ACTJJ7_20130 [Phyllobacterium sp. 22229]|uniref:hypothetical protein n=1 Tax=Phyllobacterium sp. 22229 TaxID=3453895 RepID=UPI003F870C0D
MHYIIGMFVGAILGTAAFGALIAWVLRKVVTVSMPISYIVGLIIITILGAWSYSANGTMSFVDALGFYALASFFSFFILLATRQKAA